MINHFERRQPMTADDPLRAFKAMMIWVPVCAVIDALILVLLLKG
jgi:hypothetical protein